MDQWTVLYYASGAGGLSSQISEDLNEAAKVGSGDGVNLLYQFASRRWGESAVRGKLVHGERTEEIEISDVIPGTREALRDAALWALEQCPAHRFGLILMGHGSGWAPEDALPNLKAMFAENEQVASSEDALAMLNGRSFPALFRETAIELSRSVIEGRSIFVHDITGHSLDSVALGFVLNEIRDSIGSKIGFLAFDACLMGCVEIATAIAPSVDVLIASEQLEPSRGWPHDKPVGLLRAHSAAPVTEIFRGFPELYRQSYTVTVPTGLTMSVIDTNWIEDLNHRIMAVSLILATEMQSLKTGILSAMESSIVFKADLWDLGVFLKNLALSAQDNKQLVDAIGDLLAELQRTVISHIGTNPVADSTGLSIYIPGYDGINPHYPNTSFGVESGWAMAMAKFRPHRG